MKRISQGELKSIELEILKDFVSFCKKNGYRYFLCGGTLIGAIRHKGFIPWDDDIDIMMPREDYIRCIRNYKNKYYKFDSIVNNNSSRLRFARLYDRRTVLCSSWKKEMNESVFIDIFPIDGLPNNVILQYIIVAWHQLLVYIHLSTILKFTISQRYNDRDAGFIEWKKYMRTALKYIVKILIGWTSPNIWARILNMTASAYKFSRSNYAAVLVSGPHGLKEIMPIKIYNDYTMDFENLKVNGLSGYDYYLSKLYGNYMEMPPAEKRESHHGFIAYWI